MLCVCDTKCKHLKENYLAIKINLNNYYEKATINM